MSDRRLLNGVHALARLLVDQSEADRARGWRTAGLVSGYRGSPLAGLDQLLLKQEKLLTEHDIRFVPGVNEELAPAARNAVTQAASQAGR